MKGCRNFQEMIITGEKKFLSNTSHLSLKYVFNIFVYAHKFIEGDHKNLHKASTVGTLRKDGELVAGGHGITDSRS